MDYNLTTMLSDENITTLLLLEVMKIEDVFGSIIDKTFSIAVSSFLLIRMERELKLLRAAIERLRHCAVCTVPAMETETDRKLLTAYAGGEALEISS